MARTVKDKDGTTRTLVELTASTTSTPVSLISMVVSSGGVKSIQDERGTYVLHPAG